MCQKKHILCTDYIPYNDLMIRSFVNNLVITEAEEWNLDRFVFDTYALLR